MAASILDVVATTANPFYSVAEILEQLTAFKAELVVTWSTYTGELLETGKNLKAMITVKEPLENCLSFSAVSEEAEESEVPEAEIVAEDVVALLLLLGRRG
ncbi:4-coumarate--CoA ligase 2 [Sesbania bispinosa]|nr:4-coumarate--CoA ligase 2 [Sesbania bispinosa]